MKNILKPINSFYARSGIHPKYDMGDLLTDKDNNLIVIINLVSMSDNNLYYSIQNEKGKCNKLYKEINDNFTLLKKGDEKIQYYISNEGGYNGDLVGIQTNSKLQLVCLYPVYLAL